MKLADVLEADLKETKNIDETHTKNLNSSSLEDTLLLTYTEN